MQITVKSVTLDFGDNPLTWVGAYRVYVVHPMLVVLADFHRAVLNPQVIVKGRHATQPCHRLGLAVGGYPPLYHLTDRILRLLPDFLTASDEKETYHLVAFAGGEDREILIIREHPLSGVHDFQCRSAVRAGASAKGVGKAVSAFPCVSALRAGDDTFCRPSAVVLEAMPESVGSLCVCQFGQVCAQTDDFFLYGCLGFHKFRIMKVQLVVRLSFGLP